MHDFCVCKTWTLVPCLALAMAAGVSSMSLAQDLHPSRRPSPMGMARIELDGAYVRVVYSRPYKRGRENIFGTAQEEALVPYGELWRLGANEATEITTTHDLVVGDGTLAAGTYSLFATPGAESWTIHFNSELGLFGTAKPNPETGRFEEAYRGQNDVLVVTVPVNTLEEEVDQLTFSFEAVEGGAHMVIQWITTEVRVPMKRAP